MRDAAGTRLALPCLLLAAAAALGSCSAHPVVCDVTRTTMGLSDRLVNFWGGCVWAKAQGPDATLVSLWRSNTLQDPDRAYDLTLLETPPGTRLVDQRLSRWWWHSFEAPYVYGCTQEVHMAALGVWCEVYPKTLRPLLLRQEPPVNVSLARLTKMYRECVAGTRLQSSLAERYVPHSLLRQAVGVHIRRGDKVTNVSNSPIDQTEEEWQGYYDAATHYTAELVAAGVDAFFITSDDPAAAARFATHVKRLGGSVVNDQLPPTSVAEVTSRPGGEAIVDLYRLAACRAVFLVARYSGFSFVAALLDRPTPVVVFQAGVLRAERKWLGVVHIVSLGGRNETQKLLAALGSLGGSSPATLPRHG